LTAESPGPSAVLAPSPEAGCRAATSTSGRRGLFWRLRDKQARLGLFEIGPGHELHQLTCMMQAGLWAATQVSMDHPPTVSGPSVPCTSSVPRGFELGTLAGPAFAWLRHSLGLAEEDYQAALGPGGPYLQFLSTSKSKASFFLSRRRGLELGQGREGPGVVELGAPHLAPSPLPGVHSLRVARGKKEFFIIMLSVFYPAGRISERYDIKGCEVSRWVEPAPEGSPLVLVLKDLNFQGKTIDLGPQRSWLLHQMELDTAFLRELNVLDYSLLMAFQLLHEDERGPGNSLIFRTVRSVRGVQSPEEPASQNRRLLPDSPNALHILDGPEQRYFLGLVDLATVYGLRKRLEHLWKTLRYPRRTFSTVSPARYARRLCPWVGAHTA
uniref:Phosphatidylinositol-4-phosphate 5-kinase like 1 n=1 Tax=Ursus maritimus TaxID=29073 RepID=A0A452VD09_URSMA